MNQPAVLLLSPGILKWTDMDFGLPHLVSLGGYVQAHTGIRVEILDLNYEGGDHASLMRTLDDLGPFLVIGVSTYSSFDRMRSLAVARFLRQKYPDTPIVTGGYHASAVPEDLLFDGSPFDVVMKGEAEQLLTDIVMTLLGGGRVEPGIHGPGKVKNLDALPPMRWELLNRYWPRALQLGRKLQVYLARGCPYKCTFCMERSKSGYEWRAYSPQRAVEELERLSTFTDLSQWVVNIADPLFGFQRRWRREVLEGIIEKGLLPRQYWTLTRSDDLGEEDISLLARARFSIGIGLESGSPDMLRIMNKGNKPEKYLAAVEQLSALSQEHGLNWAVNVIVGHPGETPQMANETLDFVTRLFRRTDNTRGFLSIDPFRLYPGSYIHETMDEWEAKYGAKFFHRDWWRAWYDHGFLAQHLDASDTMRFEQRVAFMHDNYRPLLQEIQQRFTGQNRSVDRVYQQSMQGQIDALSPEVRAATLRSAQAAVTVATARPEVRVPLGMNQKDPNVRIREAAVRRLLDRGVLRTESLVEALLTVDPSTFMSPAASEAMLVDRPLDAPADGIPSSALSISALATALEALEPSSLVCVMGAVNGYIPALLAAIVGPSVDVLVRTSPELCDVGRLTKQLESYPTITIQAVPLSAMMDADEPVESLFLGGCLPHVPRGLARSLRPNGRAITFVGPRFRQSRLLTIDSAQDGIVTHRGPKFTVPIMAGTYGWIRKPVSAVPQPSQPIRFSRRPAPAFAYRLLAHLDLGQDAACVHDATLISKEWVEPLRLAYQAAPGRLSLQAHALAHAGVDGWLSALTERPPASLQDEAGRHLIACVSRAADAERDDFDDWWTQTRAELSQRTVAVGGQLAQPLARLRDRLWEAQNRAAPPLVVVDAPALGAAGRATTVGEERVVAVSFAQPLAHVLMQVLHEEVHPITDPLVLAELGGVERDTHAQGAGFGVHQALEQTAVMATEAFLTQRAPELMPDFRRWHQQVFGDATT